MSGSRIARGLWTALVLPAAVVVVAGCGGSGSKGSATPAHAVNGVSDVSRALPPVRVTGASKGELSISNPSSGAIDCKIPGYRGGATFRVDDQSGRTVRAVDVQGAKVIDEVSCQGKAINGLNVTPDKDGEEVEYTADGTFRRTGYVYIHADLLPEFANVCRSTPGGFQPWASTNKGFCGGHFAGGTAPFDRTSGLNLWQRQEGGYAITTAVGTNDGDTAHQGIHIECWVPDRSSGACYTSQTQMGKTPGSQGGPLSIDAHLGQTVNPAYILVRGWCQKSDGHCIPH